ncbi:MAG: hypothetical protein JSR18_06155 [Proteobacteria bacterium]|nr:hypothetical protein [Pseudomonadota bacterium]
MFVACVAMPAFATNVKLGGIISAGYDDDTAEMAVGQILNLDSVTSAGLRLELWAFPAPYAGGSTATGFQLATYSLAALHPGYYYQDVVTGSLPLTPPPAGKYILSILLTEHSDPSAGAPYVPVDHFNFEPTYTFTDNGASTVTPHVGLWWNPSESGSGYALDYKHGTLVVTVYSYTVDGGPQWYIASGPIVGKTFTATLNKVTGGQCIACAYKAPTLAGNDGTMTITFTSSTAATMTLPGNRTLSIVPQDF